MWGFMSGRLQVGNNMDDRASLIAEVARMLTNRDEDGAANWFASHYPFEPIDKAPRKYNEREKTRVFLRDGFIDQYRGTRLVYPPALRLISDALPSAFPYTPNWKMSQTHIAYWELSATIDHLVPVTRGGVDNESNWVCCSQLTNGIKANWTLEECGWKLHKPGRFEEWDGLLNWFVIEIDKHPEWRKFSPYSAWYRAAKPVAEGKLIQADIGELESEYAFDYQKAKPNRFTMTEQERGHS